MTEDEWQSTDDVMAMLKWLRPRHRRITDRKIRLFACACCRRIEHLLTDERLRRGLAVAEAYADESVDLSDLKAAAKTVRAAWKCCSAEKAEAEAIWKAAEQSSDPAVKRATTADFYGKYTAVIAAAAMLEVVATKMSLGEYKLPTHRAAAAIKCAALQAWVVGGGEEEAGNATAQAAYAKEWRAQADLVRDLVGNPFRPSKLDPTWLGWDGGRVARLAQDIYENREFGLMPVFADALEEAGCTDAEILAHCRSGGEHVRGCWVVDLVLDKPRLATALS